MSLADALTDTTHLATGPVCTVAAILEELDPATRAALVAAIGDHKRHPGSEIARKLTAHGFPVKGNTIQRHRRKDCNCDGAS